MNFIGWVDEKEPIHREMMWPTISDYANQQGA